MKESFYAALLVLPAPSTETGSLATLLQLNETSHSCFSMSFFPPSFPVFCGSLSTFFSNSHVHRMNEELLRYTDGMKLNQISN